MTFDERMRRIYVAAHAWQARDACRRLEDAVGAFRESAAQSVWAGDQQALVEFIQEYDPDAEQREMYGISASDVPTPEGWERYLYGVHSSVRRRHGEGFRALAGHEPDHIRVYDTSAEGWAWWETLEDHLPAPLWSPGLIAHQMHRMWQDQRHIKRAMPCPYLLARTMIDMETRGGEGVRAQLQAALEGRGNPIATEYVRVSRTARAWEWWNNPHTSGLEDVSGEPWYYELALAFKAAAEAV